MTPPRSDETPEAKKERRKAASREAWREAGRLLWARRGRLAVGLGLLVVNKLLATVLPVSTKIVIDEVIQNERHDLLKWVALGAGLAIVLQSVTSFALTLLLGVAAQRSINDLRVRIHRHVARLPVSYFDRTKTGVLISRVMNDAEGIRNLVGTGFVQMVGGVFTAGMAFAVLLYINWRLTLFTIFVFAAFLGVMAYAFRKLRPIFRERGAISADVTGRLGEFLNGIRVVKAYTAEKREEIVFADGAHRLFRNIARSMAGTSGVMAASTFLLGGAGVALLTLGAREVVEGRMTIGDIFMYTFFMGLLIAPIVQMSAIGTQFTEAFAGLDRIREILGEASETERDGGTERLRELRGEIEFQGVGFEYEPGVPVLRDISFKAPAGTTTALVGSSGSGKSTLIGLVMAFNRPKEGRILADGRDLASIRIGDYRSHLGIVLQENFLFDGTIAENVAYARPRATREEVEAAARVAHVDEFASRFEKGYDTIVGERGVRLSGGQRQRIAIARAILADPRILILDEATSSLDSETEELIQDGLQRLREGRTTFVIAHRLSTIRKSDCILVLEGGRIVERGTHPELIAAGGRYRTLHDKQYRWEADRFVNPGEEFPPEAEPPAPTGA